MECPTSRKASRGQLLLKIEMRLKLNYNKRMAWSLYLIIGLVLALLVLVAYFFKRQKEDLVNLKKDLTENQSFGLMIQNLQGLQGRMDQMQSSIGQRLDSASSLFQNLGQEIGKLQDISTSVKDLQEFLKSPKLRGNIGEKILKDLLSDVFPKNSFALQYAYKDGQIVDAIIKTNKGIIPIDSKFPMEAFRRYLQSKGLARKKAHSEFHRSFKKHILAISQKYIKPSEGTVNFAVMYVPSESIYHQAMTRDQDLIDFGIKSRVLIVSPVNFYYFLHLVYTGLESHKIDKIAHSILATFEELKGDSEKLGQQMSVLAKHIRQSYLAMDVTEKQYEKINDKLSQAKVFKEKVREKE